MDDVAVDVTQGKRDFVLQSKKKTRDDNTKMLIVSEFPVNHNTITRLRKILGVNLGIYIKL